MRIRSTSTMFSTILVLLGALASPVFAQTPSAPAQTPAAPAAVPSGNAFEGIFRLGGTVNDTSGDPTKVGQYEVLKDRANLGVEFWGNRGSTHYDVQAYSGGDSRDQRYAAAIDVNRFVKVHARYVRFNDRTTHDPLTYMDSVSLIGGTFAVTSDDTDPNAAYSHAYGEWQGDVEIRLPRGVSFSLGHRVQTRDGAHQVMTIAHCSTCHTTAYTKPLDESTRDLTAGVRYAIGAFAVDYRFENRRFEDGAATLTHVYDKAQHPALVTDVFLNRVQYDSRSGALPFATVPETTKDTHFLRAGVTLPNDVSLQGTFTSNRSRNKDVGLEADFTGGTGRLVVPFHPKLVLRADLRRYSIDADSIYIDVVEPIAPAGPTAGLTYAQAYPILGSVDFLRESSASRTPTELGVELMYRPARRTYLRFGYQWEEVKRDTFEVHKTTTNTLSVLARSQLGKSANLRLRVQYDDISDPFMYEHAAIPQVLQPFQSPGNVPFTGLQYDTMYASRQADLTAFPTKAVRFEPTVTWSPSDHVSVTGHYRWRQGKNEELNFSSWERTAHNPGLDLWIAPGERWTLSAGYQYQRERLETLFSTLAFVG